MDKSNKIYENDLIDIISDNNVPWEKLINKKIFITGATGLIGSNLTKALLYASNNKNLNITVFALVRNIEKAKNIFRDFICDNLIFVTGDIRKKINYEFEIDYICHCASQTSSKEFINNPLETIDVVIDGTRNMLDIAKEKKISGFVFLSTMEVYGRPQTDEKINEVHSTNLDTMEIRNCYPISKRMAENICACSEVNTKIIRLTQTFGPGVEYNDGRVFAEFARCAIEKRDIILHTKGETKRSYVYSADAIRAIILIMLSGKNNEAYNVANENTYCSIFEMAQLVANECSENNICVKVEEEDINKFGYANTLCVNLDTSKIQNLGWKPKFNLKEMYLNLIETMKDKRK